MQTAAVQQDTANTGLFRTLTFSTSPLTFDAATMLRQVLKVGSQAPCNTRAEREVCMQVIDDLDQFLARFGEGNPR